VTQQEREFLEKKLGLLPEQIEKIERLVKLITKWNKKTNITGLKTEKEILEELVIDSMMPLVLTKLECPVMDAGCGGGFPTLPLKIAEPSLTICSVDSNRKKINFLRNCIRELNLEGIEPVNERIENLKELHGSFKTVTSKAFLPPDEAVKALAPFLSPEGKLIIFATEKTAKLLEPALREKAHIIPYTLPFSRKKRCLIIVPQAV